MLHQHYKGHRRSSENDGEIRVRGVNPSCPAKTLFFISMLYSVLVSMMLPSLIHGFSSVPRRRTAGNRALYYRNGPTGTEDHNSDDDGTMQEEFFFIDNRDRLVATSSSGGQTDFDRRQRFSVEFTPIRPRPPLHPPSAMTLEQAELRLTEKAEEFLGAASSVGVLDTSDVLLTSLVGVLSVVWTVAPILYFLDPSSSLYLLPFALLAVVISSSTLAMDAFWEQGKVIREQEARRVKATEASKRRRRGIENFQRGTQW